MKPSSTVHVHVSAEESIGRWRPTGRQVRRRSRHLFLKKLRATHSPTTSSASTSSGSSASHGKLSQLEPCCGTFSRCCRCLSLKPEAQSWLSDRLGTGEKAAIFVVFMLLNAAKFVTQESAYNGAANPFAGLVFAHLASLIFALVLSFAMEGRAALPKIFCWHAFWRLLVMATLFTTATFLTIRAYRTGLMSVIVLLLGYAYMPISVGLSYCVFRREYGKLEWLATAMMVLSTVAFLLVRERCHLAGCQLLESWSPKSDVNAVGIIFVLLSVLVSVVASLLSERLYKAQSRGLLRTCGCLHEHSLPVMKVQLDFSSALVYGLFWTVSVSPFRSLVNGPIPPEGWLGDFTTGQALLVLVIAGQSWLAALVTKRFDTVVRSLVQTLSTVVAICVTDPMLHDKFYFSRRWLASLSMAGIVFVSALVFQTGRINLKSVRRSLNLPEYPEPPAATGGLGWSDSLASMMVFPIRRGEVSRLSAEALEEGRGAERQAEAPARKAVCWRHFLTALKYSSIVLYVLADGFRTVLQSVALSETQNTPAVFVVIINACGLLLANGLTLCSNGCSGLRQSWNWRKVVHFLLCGFFFALTSTLQALAFAMGISPALTMVVGKFYTPMLAILSRWILGKFFLSLEWFAIVILTLANLAYGGLQTMSDSEGSASDQGLWATLVPSLFILASAASSCVNTLLMERLMTGEEKLPSGDSVPFHMQKVRLDAGTVLWAIAFMPAMGLIFQGPGGEKFAFWKERPLSAECSRLGTCQDGAFAPLDASSALDAGTCACGGGFFVGWDTPSIYLALVVNVFYSWITGVVVVRFSSIYRAIADAFSLALVYFVLQPLLMNGSWNDTGLDMMALLIPLSALTFSFSANEMQKVMQLVGLGASIDKELASKEHAAEGDGGMHFDSLDSSALSEERDENVSGETGTGSGSSDSTEHSESSVADQSSEEVAGSGAGADAAAGASAGAGAAGSVEVSAMALCDLSGKRDVFL